MAVLAAIEEIRDAVLGHQAAGKTEAAFAKLHDIRQLGEVSSSQPRHVEEHVVGFLADITQGFRENLEGAHLLEDAEGDVAAPQHHRRDEACLVELELGLDRQPDLFELGEGALAMEVGRPALGELIRGEQADTRRGAEHVQRRRLVVVLDPFQRAQHDEIVSEGHGNALLPVEAGRQKRVGVVLVAFAAEVGGGTQNGIDRQKWRHRWPPFRQGRRRLQLGHARGALLRTNLVSPVRSLRRRRRSFVTECSRPAAPGS